MNVTKTEKIAVVIPCYNEAKGIAKVIKQFPYHRFERLGFNIQVFVIDNNSTDNTAEIAANAGATVLSELKKGKGNALRTGFKNLPQDIDYVVMLDGDDTYSPKELLRMIEPLHSGFCDAVIGSRLSGRIHGDSMTFFNRFGNWIFTHLVRHIYRANVTDVLSGYFAWKKDAIDQLYPHLTSEGFAIEMEMITKMARLGHEIYSVPISYTQRAGDSSLDPVKDGLRIMKTFLQNLTWKLPQIELVDRVQANQKYGKKIVYVSDAVYPYNKGGKEKRLYELTTHLAEMGHDVHIYTMHWWKSAEKSRIEDGVTLHAIGKYHNMYKGDKRSIKEGMLFGAACFRLFNVKFDVLDVDHMPFFPIFSSWIVCKLRGKKLYGTWHEALTTQDWTDYMGKSGYIAALIERISVKLPYKITAISNQTKEILVNYHKRTKRVGLITPGIDMQTIKNVKPARIRCDVLYVGRLVKGKNVDMLIKSFSIVAKENPKARCVIIGDGIEKTNLQKLTKELKLAERVTILKPLRDASDIYAYMKRAKVFVLPSAREGFGIVALEALACGTPVVTIDSPANAARDLILDTETGSIVRLDEQSIAAAISFWILKSSEPSIDERFSTYDWAALAQKQAEAYA